MQTSATNPLRIVGAFAPSSKRLAHAMTNFVNSEGDRILEVGAGSGAITKVLVDQMRDTQRVDAVEFFPRFAEILQQRFGQEHSVAIHTGDILHFEAAENSYDVIVCSLPFNAFLPETTAAILEKLIYFAKDGAIMSFFEYKVLQGIASWVLPKEKREQFLGSQQLIRKLCERYKFGASAVNMNFPPAIVHYLRIDKASDRPHWRA